ncbi:ester cyclase [Maribellus sp. CM-23]|uniref:ester cyclase n=1 Tax=Maribellus sp. CM-23 TaxID=2781026 RepID=UPI001F34D2D3|nr:ester cyclase [Maribellus sp. CM-23]MCE4566112.1 ester cyclase [Maribellus sp. CM-23]
MKKIVFMILACVLMAATSCRHKTAETELEAVKAQQKVEEQNKMLVQRYWEGKWNDRRPETLGECLSADVMYHGTSMQMNGMEEYKQVYGTYLAAISDTHVEINKLMAEGELVTSYITLSGTHTGELDGLPPTGKQISVSVFTIFRIAEGKIMEEWEIMDELGFMTQLGLELGMKEQE